MSVKCTEEEWTKEGNCASTSASTSRARITARAQVATSCFQTGGTVKVSSRKKIMVELVMVMEKWWIICEQGEPQLLNQFQVEIFCGLTIGEHFIISFSFIEVTKQQTGEKQP